MSMWENEATQSIRRTCWWRGLRRTYPLVALVSLCAVSPAITVTAQEPLAEAAPIPPALDPAATPAPVPSAPAAQVAPAPPARWECNVTEPPFSADPTGATDSTEALRNAVQAGLEVTRHGGHATLTLLAGTYLVTGTISLGVDEAAARRFHIRGAGINQTTLRLKDECGAAPGEEDFRNEAAPRAMLSFLEGNYSEAALGNSLEGVTLDAGGGNPGAIGLVYHNSLYGVVRNVLIKAGEGSGHTGMLLGRRMAGPGVLDQIIIQGFRRGLVQDDAATHAYGYAVGTMALVGQREVAMISERRLLAVENLITSGTAPLLQQNGTSGLVVIRNLEDKSTRSEGTPRYTNSGLLWAHDPGRKADDAGTFRTEPAATDFMWEDIPAAKEAQVADSGSAKSGARGEVQIDESALRTETVPSPGPEVDAAPAIQAAIDNGAGIIYLPDAVYRLETTVHLKPSLQYLRGNWCKFIPSGQLLTTPGVPVFAVPMESGPPLVLERIESSGLGDGGFVWLEHIGERDLVLRDVVLSGGAGAYVGAGAGSLRLENMAYTSATKPSGEPAWLIQGQRVTGLGWTVLAEFPHIVNDGGQLEVTGLVLGNQHGPYLLNMNGARSSLNGVLTMALRQGGVPSSLPAFVNDNSDLELSLLEHSTATLGFDEFYEMGGHSVLIREFREGETRELVKSDAIARNGEGLTGSGIARYRSLLTSGRAIDAAVTVAAAGNGSDVSEGENAVVRLERTGPTEQALTVHYQLEGEAGGGTDVDVDRLEGSMVIPAGEASADLTLPLIQDDEEEPMEPLIVRLTGGPGYRAVYGKHAVRLSVLDVPPAAKAGLLARYTFTEGRGLDDSGNGQHARMFNTKYLGEDGKYALSFSGAEQWVELAPTVPSLEGLQAPQRPPRPPSASASPDADAGGAEQPSSALFASDLPEPTALSDPLEAVLIATESGEPLAPAAPSTFLHESVEHRTVVLRFRADSTQKPQTLYEEGGANGGLCLHLGGGDLKFTVVAGEQSKTLTAAVDPKFWVHVVAVFTAGEMRLYLDGQVWNDGRAPFTSIPANVSGAALARTLDGGAGSPEPGFYSGLLGDVSIYSKPLQLIDARELFSGGM